MIGNSQEETEIPKSMADCLKCDDPVAALDRLASHSQAEAQKKAESLKKKLESLEFTIPELLSVVTPDHPLHAVSACAESVHASLTKIASGGSQASQEIRKLEQEKLEIDKTAKAYSLALQLRNVSDRAAHSLSGSAWHDAAEALKVYLQFRDDPEADPRVKEYAGEYTIQQLEATNTKLRGVLSEKYEAAVQKSDLQVLGQLTPVLSMLQLEKEAVRLYKVFLEGILDQQLEKAKVVPQDPKAPPPSPYVAMGRVYNTAVNILRHHLPMVSHCLYKADGAAAVVQLVHVKIEDVVLPLISEYQKERQLVKVSQASTAIYNVLEERYTGANFDVEDNGTSDGGFSARIGSLADVDVSLEEASKCIQHAESYGRFVRHTIGEINRARKMRFDQEAERNRVERERQEWTTGEKKEYVDEVYEDLMILPASTPLQETIAEIGGYYSAIERCLLMVSMQKAFGQSNPDDPRFYRPISTLDEDRPQCLQTSLIETCMFVARRGVLRAFATGHSGTAAAMTNFAVECLTDVLVQLLAQRAEDLGVQALKPGEGLLAGGANLFNNASNLIRQQGGAMAAAKTKEELLRRKQMETDISQACAMINDLEVATTHVDQLEALLNQTIQRGFPESAREQLNMCVKSLGQVAEGFKMSADATIESLESVLKSRIRSIVSEAVGGGEGQSTFMGASTVIGGGAHEREMSRMNYELDEEAYNLIQLSESYITRLCTALDELLDPLRSRLAPRLWDKLLLGVLATSCKRLETSLRKCSFTSLGAIALDSDVRDLLSFTKDRLTTPTTNTMIFKSCSTLTRLLNVATIVSVDDLDDVSDLMSSAKRKGNWELKSEDVVAFLSARVEFDTRTVHSMFSDE